MATGIDSLCIKGMSKSDFIQLQEMFNHVMQEDIRWDRVEYWDARNERLKEWLDGVANIMYAKDIKIIKKENK